MLRFSWFPSNGSDLDCAFETIKIIREFSDVEK